MRSLSSGRAGTRAGRLAAAGVFAVVASLAAAQQQRTTIAVQSTLTVTDNGNGAPKGLEQDDVLLSVRPGIHYMRRGAGLAVQADVGADLLASARDTRPNRILPNANVLLQGTVVERLVFMDAAVDVRQIESDPFGARVESGSARNARTASTVRLSPRLDYETSRYSALAQYDALRTRYAGSGAGDLDTQTALVRVGMRPQPFGLALEYAREDDDYGAEAQTSLDTERLSAIATVALDGELLLGAVAGTERSEFGSSSSTDSVQGMRVYWNPSPRTMVTGSVDRRFFGTGWGLVARHRTPGMSIVWRSQREPSNAGSPALGGGGLASFLDAILTTRNPDALQRSELVDGLIAERGLRGPSTGAATTGVYPQLRTHHALAWVYLRARTMLSLSAFREELRKLDRKDEAVPVSTPVINDSRQHGASLEWNRQLEQQLSLGLGAQWSKVAGLGARLGEHTRELTWRANVTRNLSPRTKLSLGLLVRRVSSTAQNVNAFDETSAFAGLGHRF